MASVKFQHEGGIGTLLLANPPENQLGRQFADDLRDAVRQVTESDIRVLVIRAEGPNFGTGGDVAEWPGKDVNWFHSFISDVNKSYKTLEGLRIPTIAAVKGKAVGGHYELVLHCDLIVAAEDATFMAVEAHTGMVPLAGGVQRLADRIGRNRAAQLVLLAEPLTGLEANKIGLVYRAVPGDQVDQVVADLAKQFASGPTQSFGVTRALLKAWSAGGVVAADDIQLDTTMKLFVTDDAQRAFLALKKATEGGGDKSENEANAQLVFEGR